MPTVKQIQQFRPQIPDLPVIGIVAERDVDASIPGLRSLRDEITKDSSNALYLVAVWDELVHAHQPIAIYRTFTVDSKLVKVDVVAENGSRWIRVNTIKNTRLAMEMNPYLTDDDDCENDLDNSVLRMGTALLAAAKANPVPLLSANTSTMTIVPHVTLRLTRLDPLDNDPRIAQTIQRLRDMGIDVQLGERPHCCASPMPETPAPTRALLPTTEVNLDLSALIALVSDISHAPLPHSELDTHARFVPPQSYLDWKRERTKPLARAHQTNDDQQKCTERDEDEDEDAQTNFSGQHVRSLATQTIQEMHKGILDEIRDRVMLSPGDNTTFELANVRFWTTREARRRCLQIVAKIGGDRERQRADALLESTLCARRSHSLFPVPASSDGRDRTNATQGGTNESLTHAEAYWQHSRYPLGFLPPLVPVHIYPSTLPAHTSGDEYANHSRRTAFGDALVRTCTRILWGDDAHVSAEEPMVEQDDNEEEKEDGDVPPAARTSIRKLTVPTVTSMLAGASRGHTTLTTNRSSVRAVLRDMHGTYPSPYAYQDVYEDSTERAALWVLGPRSLAEDMRSDKIGVS